MNPEIIYLLATLLTALLGVAIGFVAISYKSLFKKYDALKKSYTELEEKNRLESQKIIEEAEEKSDTIIKSAETLSQELKASLNQAFKNAIDLHSQSLGQISDEYKKSANSFTSNLSQEVKNSLSKELETMIADLSRELKEVLNSAATDLNKSYVKAQEEVKAFRENSYKKLEQEILNIVKDTLEGSLKKTFTTSEHEDAVIKALSEAKRTGLFN